jgi:hypothetical protein
MSADAGEVDEGRTNIPAHEQELADNDKQHRAAKIKKPSGGLFPGAVQCEPDGKNKGAGDSDCAVSKGSDCIPDRHHQYIKKKCCYSNAASAAGVNTAGRRDLPIPLEIVPVVAEVRRRWMEFFRAQKFTKIFPDMQMQEHLSASRRIVLQRM